MLAICMRVCVCVGVAATSVVNILREFLALTCVLVFENELPPSPPIVKCVWLSVPHVAQLNAKTINHASLLC